MKKFSVQLAARRDETSESWNAPQLAGGLLEGYTLPKCPNCGEQLYMRNTDVDMDFTPKEIGVTIHASCVCELQVEIEGVVDSYQSRFEPHAMTSKLPNRGLVYVKTFGRDI